MYSWHQLALSVSWCLFSGCGLAVFPALSATDQKLRTTTHAAAIWELKEHVTLPQGPVTVADIVANNAELPPEVRRLTITSLNGAAPVTITPALIAASYRSLFDRRLPLRLIGRSTVTPQHTHIESAAITATITAALPPANDLNSIRRCPSCQRGSCWPPANQHGCAPAGYRKPKTVPAAVAMP